MPSDGLHDSPGIALNMMLDDPDSVRWAARVKTNQATINGVSIADLGRSLELAKAISDARSKRTADVIRERITEKTMNNSSNTGGTARRRAVLPFLTGQEGGSLRPAFSILAMSNRPMGNSTVCI